MIKLNCLFVTLLFIACLNGQSIVPELPEFDSIAIKDFRGEILKKDYFNKDELVFQCAYPTGRHNLVDHLFSMTYDIDSSYVFVSKGNFNFFFFNEENIINESFSYNSNIYKYKKYSRIDREIQEEGSFYRPDNHDYNIMQASKYKIGLWRKYNSGELIEVINYDEYLVNGEEIIFDTPEKRLLNLIKQKADSLVVNTFGSEFSEKYIVFNLDKSKFSTNSKLMNPSQPYGVQLLGKASSNSNIEYADMCYDIVINDTLRFDAIMIRIDKNLNVIGRKIIEQYPNREFFFCRGLDNTLRNKISKKALNFKRIAKKNNFSLDAKRTYISLEWERKEGIFGKLFLLIEEEVRVEDIEDGWTTYYKRIRINLNNGKQEFIEKESSETIRID